MLVVCFGWFVLIALAWVWFAFEFLFVCWFIASLPDFTCGFGGFGAGLFVLVVVVICFDVVLVVGCCLGLWCCLLSGEVWR